MKKKVDARVRALIEACVASNHRSLFVIVGDKGRHQVVNLHYILSKATVKARPSVLWCYKKELGFSSHKQKRIKQLKKMAHRAGTDLEKMQEDPFELFIAATNIRYCYYSESHKVLGNTFGMCVLQDFEALTPNLLARTIETVEGGGVVLILLKTMDSLKQLYTMTMDVHTRFRTEAHRDVVARFNERFLLSLAHCSSALVVDDELNVLPISTAAKNFLAAHQPSEQPPVDPHAEELKELSASLKDTQPIGNLVSLARTIDQVCHRESKARGCQLCMCCRADRACLEESRGVGCWMAENAAVRVRQSRVRAFLFQDTCPLRELGLQAPSTAARGWDAR